MRPSENRATSLWLFSWRPHLAEQVGELLLPTRGVRLREHQLLGHPLEYQLEQLLLVADMPVQRSRPCTQLLSHPAHREAVHPLGVEDPDRRIDDGLAGERCPGGGRTAARAASEGRMLLAVSTRVPRSAIAVETIQPAGMMFDSLNDHLTVSGEAARTRFDPGNSVVQPPVAGAEECPWMR